MYTGRPGESVGGTSKREMDDTRLVGSAKRRGFGPNLQLAVYVSYTAPCPLISRALLDRQQYSHNNITCTLHNVYPYVCFVISPRIREKSPYVVQFCAPQFFKFSYLVPYDHEHRLNRPGPIHFQCVRVTRLGSPLPMLSVATAADHRSSVLWTTAPATTFRVCTEQSPVHKVSRLICAHVIRLANVRRVGAPVRSVGFRTIFTTGVRRNVTKHDVPVSPINTRLILV